MADGITLNSGSGGADLATDEITNGTITGTFHYQVIKVAFGALNSETFVHSSVGAALPVSVLGAVSVTQSGSWTVQPGNTANTTAWLVSVQGTTQVSIVGPISVTGTVAVSVQGPVSITGTVHTSITGPVSITNGTVTANAGTGTFQVSVAGPVSITGTVHTSITGPVSIANGTVTANAGSGTFQTSIVGPVSITGTVAASLSGPVSLAAGTALVGSVISPHATGAGAIYSGTTALTPKTTCVRASASGDNVVVLSVTSKSIRVLSLALIANTTVSAYIVDVSASGTPLMGAATCPITLWPSGGFILPYNPAGWFDTTSARNLVLNLGGANQVAGTIVYVEV